MFLSTIFLLDLGTVPTVCYFILEVYTFFFKIPPLFSIFDVQQIQIQIQIFVFPIKEPFLSGRTINKEFNTMIMD